MRKIMKDPANFSKIIFLHASKAEINLGFPWSMLSFNGASATCHTRSFMLKIMIDGQHVNKENAVISVLDHGFLFGDSVYEVIRTKEGKLFAADIHLKRLRYSADKMGLPIPWDDDFLLAEMRQMVQLMGIDECVLRLVVTRGMGPLIIAPEKCGPQRRILYGKPITRPAPECYRDGVAIRVSQVRKPASVHEKGNLKTGNYLESVVALKNTKKMGFHEALLLNHDEMVAECATSNIFWIKNDTLYTPSLAAGVLRGVTRQLVLHLAKSLQMPILEGHFPLALLLSADEVFITSTSRDILPVSKIDENQFAVGPVTQKLMEGFRHMGEVKLDF